MHFLNAPITMSDRHVASMHSEDKKPINDVDLAVDTLEKLAKAAMALESRADAEKYIDDAIAQGTW